MKTKAKKTAFIITLVLLMFSQLSYATIIRVNNRPGIADETTVYSTIALAYTAAAAGDTIHIEGSSSGYGAMTLSKRLIVIGPGYFLAANDSTQAYKQTGTLTSVTFNAGSKGSVIYGLFLDRVVVNEDSVRIARCHIAYGGSDAAIDFTANGLEDVIIERNYIHQTSGTGNNQACIYVSQNCDDIVIRNNVIRKHANNVDNPAVYVVAGTIGDLIFKNNDIYGGIYLYTEATVLNNIMGIGTYAHGAFLNISYNNIGNSTQFGTADGNQSNINMNTVFTLAPNINEDEYYDLVAGSVAIDAGLHGEDCGAYREWYPTAESYIKSGMAPVPAIFDADVDNYGNGATGLNVTIHAMSHY